ncbi:MAG: GntR family transcriptional regulator, partial [Polaromonas sp.]|nr:GntR family transcriptional regulator [Polaromonas sp.]
MTAIPLNALTAQADDSASVAPAFSPLYQQIKALILQSLQSG